MKYQLLEDIEWLKIIEQGYKVNTIFSDKMERGVDTIEDYNYLNEILMDNRDYIKSFSNQKLSKVRDKRWARIWYERASEYIPSKGISYGLFFISSLGCCTLPSVSSSFVK